MSEINPYELLEFVQSKPRDEEYLFASVTDCALAQFGKFKFPDNFLCAGAHGVLLRDHSSHTLPNEFAYEGGQNIFIVSHTFGELADRLSALLPEARS